MTNGKTTKLFLGVISKEAKERILKNIADNYGISNQEAYDEVTGIEAEHLLDYVTGGERAATSLLMQMRGLR